MRIFEDFTVHLLNITKSHTGHLSKKEDETRRESIFAVAVAFEEFALNYGKQHLSGTKPSTKITSQKMGGLEHDLFFRFFNNFQS